VSMSTSVRATQAARKAIARRVAKGNRVDESATLLAELTDTLSGDSLAAALVYQGFATARTADAVVAALLPDAAPVPAPADLSATWGAPYGAGPAYVTPGGPVWMRRKGQRVRFVDESGAQVGPEQANVAPAVAYALSAGWAPADGQVSESDPDPTCPQTHPARADVRCERDPGHSGACVADGPQAERYVWASVVAYTPSAGWTPAESTVQVSAPLA
jgi:hypothetical protein